MPNVQGKLTPGLWVVSTPIGNLGDLSPRAIKVFESAAVILCEDTRVTSNLFNALKIAKKKMIRLDEHATDQKIIEVVKDLKQNCVVALTTDAGTPGISDPAAKIVSAARVAGVPIHSVPGASAVTALIAVSGFRETNFQFRGFFPRKSGVSEVEAVTKNPLIYLTIWFESPRRILKTMEIFNSVVPNFEVIVGKELTKVFEKHFSGTVADVFHQVEKEIAREGEKGEWCLALHTPEVFQLNVKKKANSLDSDVNGREVLQLLLKSGVSPSRAANGLSQAFGIRKNDAYQEALNMAKSLSKEKNT